MNIRMRRITLIQSIQTEIESSLPKKRKINEERNKNQQRSKQ
jgi:hypothetical protein